jgi:RNase P protein component
VGGYVNTAVRSPQSVNPQKHVRFLRVDPQVPPVCLTVVPQTGGVGVQGQRLRLVAKRGPVGRAVRRNAVSRPPEGGL